MKIPLFSIQVYLLHSLFHCKLYQMIQTIKKKLCFSRIIKQSYQDLAWFMGSYVTRYQKFPQHKDFNNIDLAKKRNIEDESKLRFGILLWIRFFKCLLYLSYNLIICQWQIRREDNKRKVAENKKKVEDFSELKWVCL